MSDKTLKESDIENLKAAIESDKMDEAIAFGEWLKTFPSLEIKNNQWVLESQISTKALYLGFKRDQDNINQPTQLK